MDLKSQKIIASRILKCGTTRVWMNPERVADISEAITSNDIRRLIKDGVIKAMPKRGLSSFRKKKLIKQKQKGRRKGQGSRKGVLNTRLNKKKQWIKRIRIIRRTLTELREAESLTKGDFRNLYLKAKSGFFRSKVHLMTYIERNNMIKKGK